MKVDLDKHNLYALLTIPAIHDMLEDEGSFVDIWFPHISKHIVCSWGTAALLPYLDTLFYSTRKEPRQGFPLSVLTELQTILDLHCELFPHYVPIRSAY